MFGIKTRPYSRWPAHRPESAFRSPPAGGDRALLVGINLYPAAPLRGCVNDAMDARKALLDGWRVEDVRMLLDGEATADAVEAGLGWLADASIPPGRRLFWYSGHGAALTDPSAREGFVSAICLVNFGWHDAWVGSLTGPEIQALVEPMPDECEFWWVSDSCHSGALDHPRSRGLAGLVQWAVPDARTSRAFPLPPGATAPRAARSVHAGTAGFQRVGFAGACGPQETAADALFGGGRWDGAFTFFLLDAVAAGRDAGLDSLVKATVDDLLNNGYPQHAECDGDLAGERFMAPRPRGRGTRG